MVGIPFATTSAGVGSTILRGLGKTGGALGFGAAYAGGTAIGYNETGGLFGYNRNSYRQGYPTKFKLPYYRYSNRYGRRYSRYGRRYRRRSYYGRKRFFSRYRTRRMY